MKSEATPTKRLLPRRLPKRLGAWLRRREALEKVLLKQEDNYPKFGPNRRRVKLAVAVTYQEEVDRLKRLDGVLCAA